MEKTKKIYVVITEGALQSWVRDASTFALFVALVGIGVFLDSTALQWVGAIIAFLTIISRASKFGNYFSNKADAIAFLQKEAE